MKIKKGVNLNLKFVMRDALLICEDVYKMYGRKEGVTITSARDGIHSAGSMHYYGYAIDTRIYFWSKKISNIVFLLIRSKLKEISTYYDVVIESDHIHIEWDQIRYLKDNSQRGEK